MERSVKLDTAMIILFGTAFLLVLFDLTSSLLLATQGIAFLGMVKVAMWLTAAFAIVGVGFGVMHAKRRGRASNLDA